MNSIEVSVAYAAVLGVVFGCVLAALWRIQNELRRIRVLLVLEVASRSKKDLHERRAG